jgi:hypothetical protein
MRAIGSVGERYLVSATKRRGYPRNPLWCLSATEDYDLLLPFGSVYEAFPDLESSTPTNTPTPQLRKKGNKHMKGQFVMVTSLVLTLPAGLIPD